MGNIPEYKSQSPFQAPVNKALFSEAELTENVGRGIGDLGMKTANFVFEAQMREERLRAELFQKEAALELESFVNAETDRITKDFAQTPEKAPDAFKQSYSKKVDELSKNAPFPRAKENFTFIAKKLEIDQVDRIARWGHGQQVRKLVNLNDQYSRSANVEIYRQPLLYDAKTKKYSLNKEVLDRILSEQSAFANQFEVTMDPLMVQGKNKEYRQSAVLALFNGIADQAISEAQAGNRAKANQLVETGRKLLDSKEYDYDLGQDGIQKANRVLKFVKEKNNATAKNYETLKAIDPYKYFEKRGIVLPTIDPTNLSQSITARAAALSQLNPKLGTTAPLINKADEAIMNRFIENSSPEQIVQAFRSIEGLDDGLRQEYVRALARGNMPIAYLANGMATGQLNESLAEEVLRGRELLKKDKDTGITGVVMPKQNEYQAFVDSIISNKISDPTQKKAASSIVYQALAADRARRNEVDVDFDDDADGEAVERIVRDYFGTPVEWNGVEFFGPPNSTENEVLNVIESMNEQTLKAATGATPVNAAGGEVGIGKNPQGISLIPTEVRGVFELKYNGQPLYFKTGPGTPKVPYRFNLNEYYEKQPKEVKEKSRGWFKRLFE